VMLHSQGTAQQFRIHAKGGQLNQYCPSVRR
jgi:hypothetical protein